MKFLMTLFWVVVAMLMTAFAFANWHDVTINLWGDIQADIKLPLLLVIIFAAGFLPPYVLLRARLWTARKRLEAHERERATTPVTDAAADSPAA